jgi:hypothetical protein
MNRTSTTCVLIALLALLGGCRNNSTGRTDADDADAAVAARAALDDVGLIPQTRPPIADLPVPIAFKLIEPISRATQDGAMRQVDFTFQGRDDKSSVERFYLVQMPLKDWDLTGRRLERGRYELSFVKGVERCTIAITDRTTGAGRRTTIQMNLTPAPEAGEGN